MFSSFVYGFGLGDNHSGVPASGKASERGSYIGNPGKESDLLDIKAVGFLEVQGHPAYEKPPDGFHEETADDDAPAFFVGKDLGDRHSFFGFFFWRGFSFSVEYVSFFFFGNPGVVFWEFFKDDKPRNNPEESHCSYDDEGGLPSVGYEHGGYEKGGNYGAYGGSGVEDSLRDGSFL
ncbi:hypothetical protein D3C72_518740 [compost metagenome]